MRVATFFDVVAAMKHGAPLNVNQRKELFFPLAIEKESGGGRTWNVRGTWQKGKQETLFFNEDSEQAKFFLV